MKKITLTLLCLILIVGCVSTQPQVSIDSQNLFVLSSPKLKLKIDKKYKYEGEFKYTQKATGFNCTKQYYLFNNNSENFVLILVKRIPSSSNYYWLPLKPEEGKDDVIKNLGNVKLNNKTWKSYIQSVYLNTQEVDFFYSKNIEVENLYINVTYSRNVAEKTQIHIIYFESLKGYEKEVEQYNKLKILTTEQAQLMVELLKKAEEAIVFIE